MATSTFYTNFKDGYITKVSSNYTTAHDSATGDIYDNTNTTRIGQLLSGSDYYIYRTFVFFDTSSIS